MSEKTVNSNITLANVQRLMKFSGITIHRLPSYGVSWPKDLEEKYGEWASFYFCSDGTVKVLPYIEHYSPYGPYPEVDDYNKYIQPSHFMIERAFYSLMADCRRILNRIRQDCNFPHIATLLCKLNRIEFITENINY